MVLRATSLVARSASGERDLTTDDGKLVTSKDDVVYETIKKRFVIGDPDELAFLFSGGIRLDIDYTPALVYQLAKMDGAIALNALSIICILCLKTLKVSCK